MLCFYSQKVPLCWNIKLCMNLNSALDVCYSLFLIRYIFYNSSPCSWECSKLSPKLSFPLDKQLMLFKAKQNSMNGTKTDLENLPARNKTQTCLPGLCIYLWSVREKNPLICKGQGKNSSKRDKHWKTIFRK
jgi:hypothetical protein